MLIEPGILLQSPATSPRDDTIDKSAGTEFEVGENELV